MCKGVLRAILPGAEVTKLLGSVPVGRSREMAGSVSQREEDWGRTQSWVWGCLSRATVPCKVAPPPCSAVFSAMK